MKKIVKSSILISTFVSSISGIMFLWKKSIQRTKDMENRYMSYYQLTNQWLQNHFDKKNIIDYFHVNNYKNIGIYGRGTLGELLYNEIKNSDIEVKVFIDQNVQEKYETAERIQVIGIDAVQQYQEIDVIIVTPIFDYDIIEKALDNKNCKIPIVSLENVIFN